MRADFHLLRRSALGVCGAALLGISLGGCVSTHKPRFWDQQDVKNSPDAGNSQTAAASPTDASTAKPAPTVVAADHTIATDSSGHVSSSDFTDATPPAPVAQNAVAPGSQPTAPPSPAGAGTDALAPSAPPTPTADAFDGPKPSAAAPTKSTGAPTATDPFADSVASAPAAPSQPSALPTPAVPASGRKDASTAVIVSSTGTHSADPFADSDNPVFVGKGPAQATPPASPQAAESAPAPPANTAAPPKNNVALNVNRRDGVDPFAETQPTAAPTPPAAPVTADAASPSCAAPVPSTPPAATASSTPLVQVPSRAPASTDPAADFETTITVPPVSKDPISKQIVPTSKTIVTSKPESVSSAAKPAVHEAPSLDAKELEWTRAPGLDRPANVGDAMILDSNSVRGRYTGIAHPEAKAAPVAQSETPKTSTSQPVPSPKVPVTPPPAIPAATPAPQPESAPNLDTDGPFAPSPPNVPAAGQTSHEPVHKPLSGVVNAVAQQVTPAPAADPFALEQAGEQNVAEPSPSPKPHTLASVNVAQELDPFGEPSLLAPKESVSPVSVVAAPVPSHAWPVGRAGIAFVIGLTVGLSAGLLVWLRSRLRKVRVPNA